MELYLQYPKLKYYRIWSTTEDCCPRDEDDLQVSYATIENVGPDFCDSEQLGNSLKHPKQVPDFLHQVDLEHRFCKCRYILQMSINLKLKKKVTYALNVPVNAM